VTNVNPFPVFLNVVILHFHMVPIVKISEIDFDTVAVLELRWLFPENNGLGQPLPVTCISWYGRFTAACYQIAVIIDAE
jgi:hypothetical protein